MLGVAVGALLRSQVVAITVALLWFFVAENIIATLLPAAGRWLPFQALNSLFIGEEARQAALDAGVTLLSSPAALSLFLATWPRRASRPSPSCAPGTSEPHRPIEDAVTTGPHPEADPTAGTDDVLVPLTLELSPIRGLLIVDVADDPTYRTLEPQLVDGPGGVGLVLLAYRHDGQVELYTEPDVAVDPSGYGGLDQGLLGIERTEFDPARFEVTDDGLQVDVAFTAPGGRRIELRIHEHLADDRDRIAVLAPVGGSFTAPEFFPFLWLPAMSFVPVRGAEVTLRVDGEHRTVSRLPLDRWTPVPDGEVRPRPPGVPAQPRPVRPTGGPLLAALLRLPLFRRWPSTSRWEATLDLAAPSGSGWTSRWSRDTTSGAAQG